MRTQPDNIKSLNLVSEVATFFGLLYTGINHETVGLTTELLSTLVEFASVSAAYFYRKVVTVVNWYNMESIQSVIKCKTCCISF